MKMRLADLAAVVASTGIMLHAGLGSAQTMEFSEEEAEETMTFGEEEASEAQKGEGGGEASADSNTPAKQFLEEGKRLYKKNKYGEASLLFHKVLEQETVSAEQHAPEARYELGKTLFRMNLYQGSLSQFGAIVEAGESHPYYTPALRGLLSLTEVIPSDPTLRKHLAAYADRFPQQVPEKYRDKYAYLTGRYFYSELNVNKAVEMFDYVSRRSPLYAEARYIKGISYVANYEAKPAVGAFKQVLRYLVAQREDQGKLEAGQQKLLELTNLAMARVFYSTGDYETSLKYYDKIERDSPRWAKTLFEKAWAYFQIDRYNKALGNLHSLNSPFFTDAYFPEGPILSAVIFFYNCKYDRVRQQLEEFEFTYAPLQREMQSVLDDNPGSSEMYEWYRKLRKGEVDYSDRVYRIIQAALDDKQVTKNFELVSMVEDEVQKMESMPASWRESSLGQSLMQDASWAQSVAVDNAGSLARQRLSRINRELNRLINEKKKILIEVAKAEKGAIEADIRAGQQVGANAQKAGKIKVSSEEMYWKFNGEYWRDELGQYVFNIDSQCKR